MERLTELLRCEVPIQLAPMGSVSSSPALTLAVARAGGHGVYPARGLPPAALQPVIDELAAGTAAFGINFLVPVMRPETVALAAATAPYVDFFLGDPDPALVDVVHEGGGVCGWQVESTEEARAAEAAGCDVVIAKGWESGGRKRFEGPALLPLLDAVLDVVSVPVIAAGGIATARGVAAAIAAGADGVRVGTRFIAATESDAHPAWIRAVLEADTSDAVVSDDFNAGMPVPGPHRVLRGSVDAARAHEGEEVGVFRWGGEERAVARFDPTPPTKDSTGAVEAMPLYAGQSAGAVQRVQPAAEIVAELAAAVPDARARRLPQA